MRLSIHLGFILFISLAGLYRCQEETELIIYFTGPGYVGAPGQIVKVHLHDMNFTTLPLKDIPSPDAIDYDQSHQHLYWTDTSLMQIRRSGPEGENDTLVVQLSNSSNPSGITVDGSSNFIFYADMGLKQIGKIRMDNFQKTIIVDTDLFYPKGIVAHTKNKNLFWVDWRSDQKLRSCDYDGSNQVVIADTGAIKPHGIALDQMEGRLYWADGAGHVKSVLTDGTGVKTTYTERGVIFNDITVFNGYIYLTMFSHFFLVAMPVDGNHLSILSSRRFKFPNGIHAFSPNFNVTKVCDNFKYGSQCVPCGNCIADHMCEKTTGICLAGCKAGYQSDMCHDKCEDGTWGESCNNDCGECLEGTFCDVYWGTCPSGCKQGYLGSKCDQACGRNTYGNPCKECGNCQGGSPCDSDTGRCAFGCVPGWTGERCDKACAENTYGQCEPCGHCANDASCDKITGMCAGGCERGYEGEKCDQVKERVVKACAENTYGQCEPCGHCANDASCDKITGMCAGGCERGYEGEKCDQVKERVVKACAENTYGQCEPCGHCANDASCDKITGMCAGGCERGYEGEKCDQVKEVKERVVKDLAIGLGVGIAPLILLAIIGMVVFFCIRKRRAGQPALPTVKMERSPNKEQTHENDYTTIETIGTNPIIGADELSEQREIGYM